MMRKRRPWPILLALAAALLGGLLAIAPIDGQFVITFDGASSAQTWPRFSVEPGDTRRSRPGWLYVYDTQPWSYVLIMSDTGPLIRDETWPSGSGPWQWRWRLPEAAAGARSLVFYHSCATGCRERGRVALAAEPTTSEPAPVATKLGLVFPSLTRNWHGRAGWAVELTYVDNQYDVDFSLDGLATRVARHTAQGQRVLVRVAYARGQALPPVDDEVALGRYLKHIRRLARDDRLRSVFGYLIGSGLNNPQESRRSQSGSLTSGWYARVFNGYSLPAARQDNVVEIMHAERPTIRVLVGSVTPWLTAVDGELRDPLNQPWLNFFHTTVSYIATSAVAKSQVGLPGAAPDGFALHAPGRPDAVSAPYLASDEPRLHLHRPAWGQAQAGFRVYRDWLTIINRQPALQGLPVYITASNTF
ncbi:MAG: hypothetical protein HGA65_16845, partial [Oscillochloris sp.]|nr:hypothetical protein [Oscillochloris sp.]